jgi:hypothetical protein
MRKMWTMAALVLAFVGGFMLRGVVPGEPIAHAQAGGRVFELRTYTANDAQKLAALHTRFGDHTLRIFERHGMQNIGYWRPMDAPLSENTMIYIIAHKSREAAKESWSAFGKDPEWQKVSKESEANGRILAKAPDSVFLQATDYSPMK